MTENSRSLLRQSGSRTLERPTITPSKRAELRHLYPLQAGDGIGWIAYCGHVKQTLWSGRHWNGAVDLERCVVCLDIVERRRA